MFSCNLEWTSRSLIRNEVMMSLTSSEQSIGSICPPSKTWSTDLKYNELNKLLFIKIIIIPLQKLVAWLSWLTICQVVLSAELSRIPKVSVWILTWLIKLPSSNNNLSRSMEYYEVVVIETKQPELLYITL